MIRVKVVTGILRVTGVRAARDVPGVIVVKGVIEMTGMRCDGTDISYTSEWSYVNDKSYKRYGS